MEKEEKKELEPVKNIIPYNVNGNLNTVKNLNLGIERIKQGQIKDPRSKISFIVGTGNIHIEYFDNHTGARVQVNTCNAHGSSKISIEQRDKYNRCVYLENHFFDSTMFKFYVNQLLTQNELDKQKAFEQQEQERKDALEQAHNSIPKTCAGDHRCEHCIDEQRERKRFTHQGLGSYT